MFLKGLIDDVQFPLLNTDYENFQRLVDQGVIIEDKLKEIKKDGKWKKPCNGQSSCSNTKPCLSIQLNPFFRAPNIVHPPKQVQRQRFQMQQPNF
jgi:hypothetical protein